MTVDKYINIVAGLALAADGDARGDIKTLRDSIAQLRTPLAMPLI